MSCPYLCIWPRVFPANSFTPAAAFVFTDSISSFYVQACCLNIIYCSVFMLRRRRADCSGCKGNIKFGWNWVQRGGDPTDGSQTFKMKELQRKHRLAKGDQTMCAPSSTTNSTPAWHTAAAPSAITTTAKGIELIVAERCDQSPQEREWTENN